MRSQTACSAIFAGLFVVPSLASAALVTSHIDTDIDAGALVDGVIGAAEYGANSYVYMGGGSDFGGNLGNASLYFDSDATKLYVGAAFAGSLNNIVSVYLDTRANEGFTDDRSFNDNADNGRFVVSEITRDSQDNFPVAVDYALQFGPGYTALFDLNAGGANAHGAVDFTEDGGNGETREVSIDLSDLGLSAGDTVNFLAVLVSSTGFASNEGVPDPGLGTSPGFGSVTSTVTWANHHSFVVAVPEASPAMIGWLLTSLGLAFRSRRR